jgi:DNA-directed RNA polymerase I, II, and III subunit RPABC1
MEFENIYKSRKVVIEMLQLRGYDTSKYDSQTKEELNILYQQHGSKGNSEIDTLDIIVENNEKLFVKYINSNKIRNQIIINTIDEIYESDILDKEDILIIITKDKVSYQGALEEHINRIFYKDAIFAQILWLNSLMFNITEHDLVPKYRIMNLDDKKELLDKLYLDNEKNLPKILVTDPVAKFYGVRIGDLCEIEYTNETNGNNKFYRLCIPS